MGRVGEEAVRKVGLAAVDQAEDLPSPCNIVSTLS